MLRGGSAADALDWFEQFQKSIALRCSLADNSEGPSTASGVSDGDPCRFPMHQQLRMSLLNRYNPYKYSQQAVAESERLTAVEAEPAPSPPSAQQPDVGTTLLPRPAVRQAEPKATPKASLKAPAPQQDQHLAQDIVEWRNAMMDDDDSFQSVRLQFAAWLRAIRCSHKHLDVAPKSWLSVPRHQPGCIGIAARLRNRGWRFLPRRQPGNALQLVLTARHCCRQMAGAARLQHPAAAVCF